MFEYKKFNHAIITEQRWLNGINFEHAKLTYRYVFIPENPHFLQNFENFI